MDELGYDLEDLGIEMFPAQSHVRLPGEFKSSGVGNSARRLFKPGFHIVVSVVSVV